MTHEEIWQHAIWGGKLKIRKYCKPQKAPLPLCSWKFKIVSPKDSGMTTIANMLASNSIFLRAHICVWCFLLASNIPLCVVKKVLVLLSMVSHSIYLCHEDLLLFVCWVCVFFPVVCTRTAPFHLVQAWPWAPDTLAVATWVAAEDDEADALAMLSHVTHAPIASLRTEDIKPGRPLPSQVQSYTTCPRCDDAIFSLTVLLLDRMQHMWRSSCGGHVVSTWKPIND